MALHVLKITFECVNLLKQSFK